jgi:predicted dehydrogenase
MARRTGQARIGRRRFLARAAAGAAAGAFTIVGPGTARGFQESSKVALGLVGCGGRGNWIADLFVGTGKYRVVSCADYFRDKVEATGGRLGIESSRRHSTLSGYRRLLEGKVDAVVIETPPYFHPMQAAAAVEAGKHVFLAKPIAVDAPGCLSIAASGRRASERRLVFLVDFQTRANELFREALRRVRAGDIGKLVLAEAHYPWAGGGRGSPPPVREDQLRSWYYVLPLSGDFIVEQSIHSLDIATWMLDADPECAIGQGGRKLRPEGSIWDHFAVNYRFPGDLWLSFTCIQSVPGVKDEISARVYGADGVVYGDYFGDVWIRGTKPYEGGSTGNLYTTGAVTNILEFHEAIVKGDFTNGTVAPSVRSNLTAVLGREAGYRGGDLSWKDLIREGRTLELDLAGLEA